MAKVTEVKVGNSRANKGKFHCVTFNLFDEEGADAYAELVTESNLASSGITIANIREYSRKTTVREGDGAEQTSTTTEEIILVVQYWRKKKKKSGGDREKARDEQEALKGATGS